MVVLVELELIKLVMVAVTLLRSTTLVLIWKAGLPKASEAERTSRERTITDVFKVHNNILVSVMVCVTISKSTMCT